MKTALGLSAAMFALALAGLWHFVYRYALPAAPPSTLRHVGPNEFLKADNGEKIGFGKSIVFLDFTSEDCGCSQFLKEDIDRMAASYENRGVRFVHIIESADAGKPRGLRVLDPQGVVARRFGVGATPGAVIVDAKGDVAYAGAYNRARFCDDPDSAFAEQALNAILQGRKPPRERTPFYGCAVSR